MLWFDSGSLFLSCELAACEREGVVGGDEGRVGGVAQVVCHGVKVVGVHGEVGGEEDGEVQGEVKEKSNNSETTAHVHGVKMG